MAFPSSSFRLVFPRIKVTSEEDRLSPYRLATPLRDRRYHDGEPFLFFSEPSVQSALGRTLRVGISGMFQHNYVVFDSDLLRISKVAALALSLIDQSNRLKNAVSAEGKAQLVMRALVDVMPIEAVINGTAQFLRVKGTELLDRSKFTLYHPTPVLLAGDDLIYASIPPSELVYQPASP